MKGIAVNLSHACDRRHEKEPMVFICCSPEICRTCDGPYDVVSRACRSDFADSGDMVCTTVLICNNSGC